MYRVSDFTKTTYKTGEVAKILGVTTRTIQNYDYQGILKVECTIKNHRCILREDLLDFLDKKELLWKTEEFKKLRKIAGMNRTEFSIYMGIPRRTLEDWGGGRRKVPDYVVRLISYKIKMESFLKKSGIEYQERLDE